MDWGWERVVPGAIILAGLIATMVATWKNKKTTTAQKLLETADELQDVYAQYEEHRQRQREEFDNAVEELREQADGVDDFVDRMRKKLDEAGP